ncbi:MAG: uroporphyrinogen-III C-methyltransferase, partial [Pseudomonadales bacterium]|nr:uroporphyrinogen-III C-methyltransferase [Pseudomonadales bacterium]
ALLRLEQPIFDEELRKVDTWVGDYFDPTAAAHQAFLADLGQLKIEIIQPELPTVEASIAALAQVQTPQAVSP